MLDKLFLKGLILEQKKALMLEEVGVVRAKYAELVAYLPTPHALIISGLRRAGKSTLLLQLIKKQYDGDVYYFNFEDERLIDFTVEDFNNLYEVMIELYGKQSLFFLDEVQIVSGWERFVRRLQNEKMKFIITGSNASLLSRELGTKLTGRHIQIELLPYSFKEFLNYFNVEYDKNNIFITSERGLLKNKFNEYMRIGGIPEYVTYQFPHILSSLYENILYKDIIVRYEIQSVRAFRELAIYLINNIGTFISYTKIKNVLQLGSINTVKNYVHYLENSYLIFTIESYDYSILKQKISQKKVYVIDAGLVNIMSTQFSRNTGRCLENIVFLELRRRYQSIYYYKTEDKLEVDFVVQEGKKIISLIQVCETLNNETTRHRELTALQVAMKELNVSEGLILTLDESGIIEFSQHTKVTIMPIYQWLIL